MRYYIADCHFFHEIQLHHMDCRGFASVEEMNEYMIRQWNEKVRPRDEVVILGDLSWGSAEETNDLLQRLNGILYLIRGNHDRFGSSPKYDSSRFVWIKPYAEIHDNNRKVVLCHYPIMCYNGQYHEHTDHHGETYMLYGHVHDSQDQRLIERFQEITLASRLPYEDGRERSIPSRMINCFCKYSDYKPLSLDEWIECDRKRRESRPFCPEGLKDLYIP